MGDAATLVPDAMWEANDDLDLLRRQYPSMVAWVELSFLVLFLWWPHGSVARSTGDRAGGRGVPRMVQ